ncbi:hypothetical protein LTR56_022649 [Elasticomyces elasticus]|nr:hypothetical protein LTR56_022649 [Elasticomyces elasticus]KAK3624245.1 hypothetical protein LTR22_024039 [Elasticomyces elasticus]KAK4921894.1 hypothetical protein LTR49_010667 [Elasticomyces elasticus]KAK5758106.1 hypothetical protein LTS12_011722 [Elasticomyces elasticus]
MQAPMATMAGLDDSDYGSDVDEQALDAVLSSCSKASFTTRALAADDESDIETCYGSDIDETAELVLLYPTPTRPPIVQPPKDMQSLGISADQSKSSLMALPPELRNLIYEKLFEEFVADWIPCKFYTQPHMLLACKQIYGEAISVFYCTATFRAQNYNMLEKRIRRLRLCHRRLVQNLDIDTQADFEKLGGFLYLSEEKRYIKEVDKYAEIELSKIRGLLKSSSLKELQIQSLRASIKLPNGEIIWCANPTKALTAYEDAEKQKKSKAPAPAKSTTADGTVTRVTISDHDWADGVWSSSLQTFVLIVPDD